MLLAFLVRSRKKKNISGWTQWRPITRLSASLSKSPDTGWRRLKAEFRIQGMWCQRERLPVTRSWYYTDVTLESLWVQKAFFGIEFHLPLAGVKGRETKKQKPRHGRSWTDGNQSCWRLGACLRVLCFSLSKISIERFHVLQTVLHSWKKMHFWNISIRETQQTKANNRRWSRWIKDELIQHIFFFFLAQCQTTAINNPTTNIQRHCNTEHPTTLTTFAQL